MDGMKEKKIEKSASTFTTETEVHSEGKTVQKTAQMSEQTVDGQVQQTETPLQQQQGFKALLKKRESTKTSDEQLMKDKETAVEKEKTALDKKIEDIRKYVIEATEAFVEKWAKKWSEDDALVQPLNVSIKGLDGFADSAVIAAMTVRGHIMEKYKSPVLEKLLNNIKFNLISLDPAATEEQSEESDYSKDRLSKSKLSDFGGNGGSSEGLPVGMLGDSVNSVVFYSLDKNKEGVKSAALKNTDKLFFFEGELSSDELFDIQLIYGNGMYFISKSGEVISLSTKEAKEKIAPLEAADKDKYAVLSSVIKENVDKKSESKPESPSLKETSEEGKEKKTEKQNVTKDDTVIVDLTKSAGEKGKIVTVAQRIKDKLEAVISSGTKDIKSRVVKKDVKDDEGNTIEFALECPLTELQVTKNGCWSHAMANIMHVFGHDLTTEEIRAYRPKIVKELGETRAAQIDFVLSGDNKYSIAEHTDLLARIMPQCITHTIEYSLLGPGSGELYKNASISERQRVIDNMTLINDTVAVKEQQDAITDINQHDFTKQKTSDMITKQIKYALEECHCPVALNLNRVHFVTVFGYRIEEGKTKLIARDSMSKAVDDFQTYDLDDLVGTYDFLGLTFLQEKDAVNEERLKDIFGVTKEESDEYLPEHPIEKNLNSTMYTDTAMASYNRFIPLDKTQAQQREKEYREWKRKAPERQKVAKEREMAVERAKEKKA